MAKTHQVTLRISEKLNQISKAKQIEMQQKEATILNEGLELGLPLIGKPPMAERLQFVIFSLELANR